MNGLKNWINYPEFIDFLSSFDILCLSETHLDDTDIVDIANCSFISKNISQAYKRKSGGIGVYVKDTLSPFIHVLPNQSEYVLWISINKAITNLDEDLIFGALYIPPENSRFFSQDLFMVLEEEITSKCNEFKHIYLSGDTNCRDGTMPDFVLPDSHLNDFFEVDYVTQTNLFKHQVLLDLSFNLQRNTNGLKLQDI